MRIIANTHYCNILGEYVIFGTYYFPEIYYLINVIHSKFHYCNRSNMLFTEYVLQVGMVNLNIFNLKFHQFEVNLTVV